MQYRRRFVGREQALAGCAREGSLDGALAQPRGLTKGRPLGHIVLKVVLLSATRVRHPLFGSLKLAAGLLYFAEISRRVPKIILHKLLIFFEIRQIS